MERALMASRLVSQSFLGPDTDAILAGIEAGVVGLGGGGSHVVQQLAHVGVGKFVPVDHDTIEEKNLNRLIGGTAADVDAKRAKTEIAQRMIKGINPGAQVTPCLMRWQDAIATLRRCDVIFGCVDSYRERDELERFARRFLIPYIDLGMDVHEANVGVSISGQTVLSSPGGPCLWCLGILTEQRIALEARNYGKAGSRPQVVWANGVLASLAVGLFVQMVCPWHGAPKITACCEFDGNRHRVETNRLDNAEGLRCSHFQADELGDAFFGRV
jgi:molybdopterin/thiamine biosynthesis adenylyltransferase